MNSLHVEEGLVAWSNRFHHRRPMVLHPRAPRSSEWRSFIPKEEAGGGCLGHPAVNGGGNRATGMAGQQMMGFMG
jgi:hypothetical protein